MKGTFYAVGVGPGDPDLITLKASKCIQSCRVIAIPKAVSEEATARKIIEPLLTDQEELLLSFSMDKDPQVRKAHRRQAAKLVAEKLDAGLDVALITLGDPSIYSTAMYVHKILKEAGYVTKMIPGIPSFCAVAAALDIPLCEGEEALLIQPGQGQSLDEKGPALSRRVIMKAGKNMAAMVARETEGSFIGAVRRATMEGQEVYFSKKEFEDSLKAKEGKDYFSIMVVKE